MGSCRLDVLDAVRLFGGRRTLVTPDGTVLILVYRAGAHNARLAVSVLLEAVEVVAR